MTADEQDSQAWLHHARRGELEAAWQASDRILERGGSRRDRTIPRHQQQIWDGTPLAGRRVLVRCYHGLGDTIQFVRYLPLVGAIAREVTVWAQQAVLPLLRSMAGIDRLLPLHDGTPGVEYEVDVEIMELAHVFRSTLQTIPSAVPYLFAEPVDLAGVGSPRAAGIARVGLVWRAGDWDARRSIPFELLTLLFEREDMTCYSLQHQPAAAERHPRLPELDTDGLLRTAQCMRAMDLVISCDSMSAHLAGALGVPVWTLLPLDPDWRWMEDRSDSPWYPSMRLFRQRRGGWPRVVDDVAAALESRLAVHGRR